MWRMWSLRFHHVEDDRLIAYSHRRDDDVVMVVVNLAPDELVESTLHVDPGSLGLPPEGPYLARDELTGEEWTWEGPTAYVKLGPDERVAHVLSLVRHHGP